MSQELERRKQMGFIQALNLGERIVKELEKVQQVAGYPFVVVNELPQEIDNKINNIIEQNETWLVDNEDSINWDSDKIEYLKENFEVLGKGACGIVIAINDELALKYNYTDDYETRDSHVLAKLQGAPLTLKLYKYSKNNEYMVVERVKGKTLFEADELHLEGEALERVTNREIIEKEFDRFFEFCSRVQIMPSDMHKGNVMVTETGEFKIVDYGLFKKKRANLASIKRSNAYEMRDILSVSEEYSSKFLQVYLSEALKGYFKRLEEQFKKVGLSEDFIMRTIVNARREIVSKLSSKGLNKAKEEIQKLMLEV